MSVEGGGAGGSRGRLGVVLGVGLGVVLLLVAGVVLVRHWSSAAGGGWRETRAPDIGGLSRVVAVDSSTAYAFVEDLDNDGKLLTAMAWDGGRWTKASG